MSPNRPAAGNQPGAVNEELIAKVLGNPVGELFGKLLSARELRLEGQQREALHKLAAKCNQRAQMLRQRVIGAIKGMNRQERSANARKTVGAARGEMYKLAGEARKHVFGILKPEQRPIAGRILGPHGPAGPQGAKPSPPTQGGCKSGGCRSGGCKSRKISPTPRQ